MKIKKKYIVIGFVILLLIISGIFFLFWKKSKSQNTSSNEDDEEDDFPINHDEKGTNMGYSTYSPPYPSPNISEKDAKKEVLKTLSEKHPSTPPKKVWNILSDVNIKMSKSDRENLGKEFDWDFTKTSEQVASKYQKNVFSDVPNQTKFEEALQQTSWWFFFADYNIDIPHKENGEIDWIESLKWLASSKEEANKTTGAKIKTKTHAKTLYKELKEEIELKVNAFFYEHAKKFPNLTNLDELNQWLNIEAQKRHLASGLAWRRYEAAKMIGKQTKLMEINPPDYASKAIFENKKFNLTYKLKIYKVEDNYP